MSRGPAVAALGPCSDLHPPLLGMMGEQTELCVELGWQAGEAVSVVRILFLLNLQALGTYPAVSKTDPCPMGCSCSCGRLVAMELAGLE